MRSLLLLLSCPLAMAADVVVSGHNPIASLMSQHAGSVVKIETVSVHKIAVTGGAGDRSIIYRSLMEVKKERSRQLGFSPQADDGGLELVGQVPSAVLLESAVSEEEEEEGVQELEAMLAKEAEGRDMTSIDLLLEEAAKLEAAVDAKDRLREFRAPHSSAPLMAKAKPSPVLAKASSVFFPLRATGSGFLADVDPTTGKALVITNSHVVTAIPRPGSAASDPRFGPNAHRIVVELLDGSRYDAKVLGKHEYTDVAILELQNFTSSAKALPMASGASLEKGQWTMIVGAPLGLEQSTTVGIVSKRQRYMMDGGLNYDCTPLIQTDAAINEGNSGGPALSRNGEVIGIVTSKLPSAENMGFLVPADSIRKVVKAVVTNTAFPRVHLGLSVSSKPPVTLKQERVITEYGEIMVPDQTHVLRLSEDDQQVFVAKVLPESSAEKAGIKAGDELLAISGSVPHRVDDFKHQLCAAEPNKAVELKVRHVSGSVSTLSLSTDGEAANSAHQLLARKSELKKLKLAKLASIRTELQKRAAIVAKELKTLAQPASTLHAV